MLKVGKGWKTDVRRPSLTAALCVQVESQNVMTLSADVSRNKFFGVALVVILLAGVAGLLIPWAGSLSAPMTNGGVLCGMLLQAIVLASLGAFALLYLSGQKWSSKASRKYFGALLIASTIAALPAYLVGLIGVRKLSGAVQTISDDEALRARTELAPLLQERRELLSPPPLSVIALRRPEGIRRSRVAIRRLTELEAQILQTRLLGSDRYDRRVTALAAPSFYIADFKVEGQRQALVAKRQNALTLELLNKMDEQLVFLERTRGRWSVREAVVFARTADFETFKRLDREAALIRSRLAE